MFRSTAAAAVAVAHLAAAADPPLDPQPGEPYVWRVVVAADPDPRLPAAARDRLADDLRAALGPLVGPLGRVEVVDLSAVPAAGRDPLLDRFAARGWAGLEPPAAGGDQAAYRRAVLTVSGVKTHFVAIAPKPGGGYRVEARQHDGDTGLLSPLRRAADAAGPDVLGRVAGRLVGRDFGPVATVTAVDRAGGTAAVRFRGGAVGGLDRFVGPDAVLAVAAVADPASGARTTKPVPFTVLQLTGPVAADGTAPCRVLSRFRRPLAGRGVAGFRGLALATVDAPVQVRLVDPATGAAAAVGPLVQVRADDRGFPAKPDPRDGLEPRDGVFRSARRLRHLACVVVGLGYGRQEQFPVPVLGAGPVALPFAADPKAAARAAYERDCEEVRLKAAEARAAQVALFEALAKLIEQGKNPAALARVRAGLAAGRAAEAELAAEVDHLRKHEAAKDPLPAAYLAAADNQLALLRNAAPALAERERDLAAAVDKAHDPVRFEREFRAKELKRRADEAVAAGDVPTAADQLTQLADATKDPKWLADRDRLLKEYEPKGPAHAAARATADRRGLTADEWATALPELDEAVDVLVRHDDRFGLRAAVAAIDAAFEAARQEADQLDGEVPAEQNRLRKLNDVTVGLRAVDRKARTHLRKLEAAAPPAPAANVGVQNTEHGVQN